MKTAAAYIRVSTEDQTEYSPDSQLKKIKEYTKAHHLLLPEAFIFLDEGISGKNARNRPAFMKMIQMARQKPRPFDLILVWKFSRFARSRQDSIFYKSMLKKDCGIHVVSITEQLSDDPTAILIEALLEAMDEYYSINLAQEVRRGMNEKFSRGGVVSVPPFGYRMGPEHFEPDPDKAPFLPMIFQDFLNGSSFRQIALRLNALGVCTVRGNLFESRSVEYILTNPTYIGKLRRSSGKEEASMLLVDGRHPALIDPETFRQVQNRIMESKKSRSPCPRTAPARYMLQGLVRCSCCGSTLVLSEKGKSLQCHRYAKGLCGKSHHIRLDILNQAVLSVLKTDLEEGTIVLQFRKKESPGDTALFSRLLKQETRRLERIKAAYEAGADSLEEYKKSKADACNKIHKLKEKLQQPPGQSTSETEFHRLPLHCALSLLEKDAMTEPAKNVFLRSLLSHITFYRSESAVQLHYH